MYINAKQKSTQKAHTVLKTVYHISSVTDKTLSQPCNYKNKSSLPSSHRKVTEALVKCRGKQRSVVRTKLGTPPPLQKRFRVKRTEFFYVAASDTHSTHSHLEW